MHKTGSPVTLTTDFGLLDPYVGIMKGVLLSINPRLSIIDITHQLRPGAIQEASALLGEAYPYFPKETIHVVVVDPGVGTTRRAVLVMANDHFFVGPDNGVFWPIMASNPEATVLHLVNDRYFLPRISRTFHGRDIFAPVAAHLSLGVKPGDMGPIIGDPERLEICEPHEEDGCLVGHVIRVDRFGNLLTNILKKDLEAFLAGSLPEIRVGNVMVRGLHETYADVAPGMPLALIGSAGTLEIAVNRGHIHDRLEEEGRHMLVTVRPLKDGPLEQ